MFSALLLSTYPIGEPRHGGQVRLAEIARCYASLGATVQSMAVYEPHAYTANQLGSHDFPFLQDNWQISLPQVAIERMADYFSGQYALQSPEFWQHVQDHLPGPFDLIHVEQPWLWPVARKIAALQGKCPLMIYGSQNIEAPLKQAVLADAVLTSEQTGGLIQAVAQLERTATQEADLVLAVSCEDGEQLEAWGARELLLAENGIRRVAVDAKRIDAWAKRLPTCTWPLYISSAHRPNYAGFAKAFGESLACIPQGSRLVVAGSVTPFIEAELLRTPFATLNQERLQLLGGLNDEDLQAVKQLAHAFVLPIHSGAGTNLKTAEALYSGKHVVASALAMRGYEAFFDLPQVHHANRPHELHRTLACVLHTPLPQLSPKQREHLEILVWEKRLELLGKRVGAQLG